MLLMVVVPATGRRAATAWHREASVRTRREEEGGGGVEDEEGQDEVVAAEALHGYDDAEGVRGWSPDWIELPRLSPCWTCLGKSSRVVNKRCRPVCFVLVHCMVACHSHRFIHMGQIPLVSCLLRSSSSLLCLRPVQSENTVKASSTFQALRLYDAS